MNFERHAAGSRLPLPTARKWIDANAPIGIGGGAFESSLGRIRLQNHDMVEVGQGLAEEESRWRLGLSALAQGLWRARRDADRAGDLGQQEEGVYGKLTQPFQIGEGIVRADRDAYGSEEHKRHYLPKLAAGDQIWCQLFSEPAGGVRCRGLRMRAEKQGDNWIVNGQKIWTIRAHYSDYVF